MPIKFLFTVFLLCFFSFAVRSQAVVFVNAGSRAAWGDNQELTIYKNGNCRYALREVNGTTKDSSSFAITPQQLNSIFQKANELGFFSLNKEYKGTAVDGSGVYISMNNAGKKNHVSVVNISQPAIKELLNFMNELLASRSILISYGY
jgi:hypothetical protein